MLMLPARTTSPPNVGGLAHTTTIDASSQVTIMRTVVLEPPPMKKPPLPHRARPRAGTLGMP